MKMLLVFIVLLLAGCATGFTGAAIGASSQSNDPVKNGSPGQFERLGVLTSKDVSTRRQCGSRQVSVCSTSEPNEPCQCMAVNDAESRLRHAVHQHRAHGSH